MPEIEEKIVASVDRHREAHFYIHMMEHFYHEADAFRWSLNSFLRALKEVPQLLQMELQRGLASLSGTPSEETLFARTPLSASLRSNGTSSCTAGCCCPRAVAQSGSPKVEE